MLYKSAVRTYLITLFVLLMLPLTVIYVSDPYMLFHKHWFHHGQMYQNARIQNYGLIKYGKFDGIILGSSMLENTSANEANTKLGGNFANISVSGMSPYERYKILDFALNTRKIKHIIFSLDYKFNKEQIIGEAFIPELYSMFPLRGKIKVYSTDKALKCIFKNKDCDFIDFGLDRPHAWFKTNSHNRRFGGFENWIRYYKVDNQIKDAFKELKSTRTDYSGDYSKLKEVIDNETMSLFKHNETEFSIIIPPYSILWWSKRKASLPGMFEPYIYLIKQTAQYKNVKIYWFYDEDYVADITKYKDLTHYYYTINSSMLDAIKNGTNIINETNYEQKLKDFTDRINNFDIDVYIRQIPEN